MEKDLSFGVDMVDEVIVVKVTMLLEIMDGESGGKSGKWKWIIAVDKWYKVGSGIGKWESREESVFKRISTSSGGRIASLLNNT